MTIKIKTATWIGGEPVKAGEFVNTDDETARELIRMGRADISATAPKTEPAKPTFTREK